ncbi:MAG: hypothetical protein GXY83_42770 [Rhodopirellula sp.]|nr:hypothetical protein [Rhodopirellula sp.]
MAAKSILELDEARRRFQQMTDDHRQLAELLAKLRTMRDALARTLDDAEKRLRDANKIVDRANALMTNAGSRVDEFGKKSEVILADVLSAGAETKARLKKLGEDTRQEVQALTGQVSTAICEMQGQFSDCEVALQGQLKAWTDEQDRRFASFREHHAAVLVRVQEAYDRARAALESHAPLFDRLDGKVDKLIESHADSAAALRRDLEDARSELTRTAADLLARVRAEMATSAKAVKEETAAECARMLKIQGEQGHQLRILHRRIRYARILLWVVLLASGVALGGLVWQQRADFLSFLENLVRSLG